METHAHHLHKAPGKNFWHYFFEFFMLFLAVFCGFLAENYREHVVEHEREIQYMKSMCEDLNRDISQIDRTLNVIDSLFLPVFDKSLDLIYRGDYSDKSVIEMYENIPKTSRFLSVNFETRTINQLQNSGNLRLIRNHQVTDSLAAYWQSCNELKNPILPGYAEIRSKTKELVYNLFSMQYFNNYAPFSDLKINEQPKLLSNDSTQFIKLANYISNLRSQSSGPIKSILVEEKGQATNLIKLIKSNYSFE
jgi:hypothetical protein